MTAPQRLLSLFDAVVVISLPERTDRRAEMHLELAGAGVPVGSGGVTIFDAIRPSDPGGFPSIGARGCFLSHLGALRQAREKGVERLLILEDDAVFGRRFKRAEAEAVATLAAEPWDMTWLGWALPKGVASLPRGAGPFVPVPPDRSLMLTHAVAFTRPAIAAVIPYLEAMLTRPAGSSEGGPMHVDGAYSWFRAAHTGFRTLAAVPSLVVQSPSTSDITTRMRWVGGLPLVSRLRRVKAALQAW